MSEKISSLPVCHDRRIPARDICVLRDVIDRWAVEKPDDVYVVFENGEKWSFKDVRDKTVKLAAGLQNTGVKQGDHVAVWLPNGSEALLTFFAINYIGAVFVPFNTAYLGTILEHVIENSDAEIIIIHENLVSRLNGIRTHNINTVVVVGEGTSPDHFETKNFADLRHDTRELRPLDRPINPWDTQSIIYTSGTTGPSKGVLSSYLHMYSNAGPESWPFVKPEDRFLINMPMFHIGGMGVCFAMLVRGGSIAMMENFSTDGFWPFVKKTQCTVIFLLGIMVAFLTKKAPSEDDKNHHVRTAFVVPLSDSASAFNERYGVDVYTIFNMTEISSPIVSSANPENRGTCGKVRPGVQVRLVDKYDCEVPVGGVGEMIVRTDRPWAMNHGYQKNPKASFEAWRNGWFHTGDAFRCDEEGNFFFIDRVNDSIRRRGENISSFEVEAELLSHPDIQEAAAIGVKSEFSEEEVLAVIAPVAGRSIDPEEIIHYLSDRMPYFMIPRYIRQMSTLPKTPTAKVQKASLREEGLTEDAWDREQAGIKIKRIRI
ncbi:MAG: ATP-dependent acyl-CoA ligase [Alphaproteobacteria bacterium]|nr:MAG: ATP-dependent acyl-CoA ligase [Alphaproteobacteria bacterium]